MQIGRVPLREGSWGSGLQFAADCSRSMSEIFAASYFFVSTLIAGVRPLNLALSSWAWLLEVDESIALGPPKHRRLGITSLMAMNNTVPMYILPFAHPASLKGTLAFQPGHA